MERVARAAPPAAMSEIVPIRNDVAHRTAGVALAEGHAAIHAAGALFTQLVLRHGSVKLAPVLDTCIHRLARGRRTAKGEKSFRITHAVLRPRRSAPPSGACERVPDDTL